LAGDDPLRKGDPEEGDDDVDLASLRLSETNRSRVESAFMVTIVVPSIEDPESEIYVDRDSTSSRSAVRRDWSGALGAMCECGPAPSKDNK
jgi:hypothetical protein